MDSTSVARQRIPLVVHKLSVPHCSPDRRPLLVLIRRPHCQSTPLPHLVHTIRTTHSSVCGNVAHHSGECCTPHRECCTPQRGMLHTTAGVLHTTAGMLHTTPVMLRTTPGNVAHHTGNVAHHTGLGGPLAATSPLVPCSIAPRPSSAAVITRYRHLDWSKSWTCSSFQHAYWP